MNLDAATAKSDDPRTQRIAAAFERTNRKKYENYVVTGVWHRLRDKGILLEPVTQQYVKRPEGYALLDLYFPALNVSVECDEKHHLSLAAADRRRTLDILEADKVDPLRAISAVSAGAFEELRVVCADLPEGGGDPVFKPVEEIDGQIDEVVAEIVRRYKELGRPAWDPRPDVEKLAESPEIRVSDGWLFPRICDIVNGFGSRKKDGSPYGNHDFWSGSAKLREDGRWMFFLHLTVPGAESGRFDNLLDFENGKMVVTEYCNDPDSSRNVIAAWERDRALAANGTPPQVLIFGRARNAFGTKGYRFLGEFKLAGTDLAGNPASRKWKRVSETAKTIR